MNKRLKFCLLVGVLILKSAVIAQTVWSGPKITFTKANHADWTLESNQDRITDSVWITRGDFRGLFNSVKEVDAGYTNLGFSPAPTGTEWAYGSAENYETLTFESLNTLIGNNYKNIVDGRNMVLHLIEDDIYIDVKFLSWTQGSSNGGGFSYERSTPSDVVGIASQVAKTSNTVIPNPSHDFISITGASENSEYVIFNSLGQVVLEGTISTNDQIDVSELSVGSYFLKVDKELHKIIKL